MSLEGDSAADLPSPINGALASSVLPHQQPTSICVSRSFASAGALVAFLRSMPPHPSLTDLDLSHCSGEATLHPAETGALLRSLEGALRSMPSLKSLSLEGNRIFGATPHPLTGTSTEALTAFTRMLCESSVTQLNVSDTLLIGSSGRQLTGLASLCENFIAVQAVSLIASHNSLHSLAISMIAKTLHSTHRLTHLDLSHNLCTRDGAGCRSVSGLLDLTKGLLNNHSIRHLDLGYCGLHDEDMALLCSALEKMPQLEYLSVAGNQCQGQGMFGISGLLTHHSLLRPAMGIRHINLSSNPIGDNVLALRPGLETSETLIQLDVVNCLLDDVSAESLLVALGRNFTLTRLNFSENAVGEQVSDAISAEIKGNGLLKQIISSPYDIDVTTLEAQVWRVDTHRHCPKVISCTSGLLRGRWKAEASTIRHSARVAPE